jgi:hypothetical protein
MVDFCANNEPSRKMCPLDNFYANVGIQDNSAYRAFAPFLPLLREFLKGVELSAGQLPLGTINSLLDATLDTKVNLHTLVDELETQANAESDKGNGKPLTPCRVAWQ